MKDVGRGNPVLLLDVPRRNDAELLVRFVVLTFGYSAIVVSFAEECRGKREGGGEITDFSCWRAIVLWILEEEDAIVYSFLEAEELGGLGGGLSVGLRTRDSVAGVVNAKQCGGTQN